jgi:hypothetical protein
MIVKTKIMTKKTDSKANWNNNAGLISLIYGQLQTRKDVKQRGFVGEYFDSHHLDYNSMTETSEAVTPR